MYHYKLLQYNSNNFKKCRLYVVIHGLIMSSNHATFRGSIIMNRLGHASKKTCYFSLPSMPQCREGKGIATHGSVSQSVSQSLASPGKQNTANQQCTAAGM